MKLSTQNDCKVHPDQKLIKFCKEDTCWEKLCPQCAAESHRGHNVIECKNLAQDAKNAKDKLIQSKRGDLMSIKRLISGIQLLKDKLKSIQLKRKGEKAQMEQQIMAELQRTEKEDKEKQKELQQITEKFFSQLSNYYNIQAQEMEKIPDLANAVITKGTIDDLRTFFEMCKEGSDNHSEILQYKNRSDTLKKDIEDFIIQNPFKSVTKLDKSLFESSNHDSSFFDLQELTSIMNESSATPAATKTTSLISPSGAMKSNKYTRKPSIQIQHSEIKTFMARRNSASSLIQNHGNSKLNSMGELIKSCASIKSYRPNKPTTTINSCNKSFIVKPSVNKIKPLNNTTKSTISNYAKPSNNFGSKRILIFGKKNVTEVKKQPLKRTTQTKNVTTKIVNNNAIKLKNLKIMIKSMKIELKNISINTSDMLRSIICNYLIILDDMNEKLSIIPIIKNDSDKIKECKLYMMNFSEELMEFMLKDRIKEQKALCMILVIQ